MTYKQEGHRFSYYRIPAANECSEASRPVAAALLQLKQYSEWIHQLPGLSALKRILDESGLLPYIAVQEAGATRAGSLIRLLHIVQDDPEAVNSWPTLTRLLLLVIQGNGLETLSLYGSTKGVVRIMNLNKAKGLEAPVVFLAGPYGESDHDADQHIDRSGSIAKGYFTISQRLSEHVVELIAQPPNWKALSEKERLFVNAEKDRLLYVAATRAKQLLVVSLYPEQPAKCSWSSLMYNAEHVAELIVHEGEPEGREVYAYQPMLEESMSKLSNQLLEAKKPSYRQVTVTELTKTGAVIPGWSVKGRGQAFGNVVHRCIEAIGNGRVQSSDGETYIKHLAKQEGLKPGLVTEAVVTVELVLGSELWPTSIKAKRRLFEVSMFSTKKVNKAEGLYVKGVIDFLFEEDEGWVIVGYKTDMFESESEEDFIRFYSPQVLQYASEWNQIFGYPVKEAGLFFTQFQKYVPIRLEESE
ncbi:3'-5' exonuclease [Paenibacillus sp. XY044]|uniref:3'-5' exonuclease n=1 Tax=Paenibacillus sp. XY044 TaxID=2026089 RepID=UPI000B98403F|nr:3'-5' exonuclease [Paenibacillus sp. XY044]OZB96549.1 hypothetical protein CJP46_11775 [Paenibacillus sp. XY044]